MAKSYCGLQMQMGRKPQGSPEAHRQQPAPSTCGRLDGTDTFAWNAPGRS